MRKPDTKKEKPYHRRLRKAAEKGGARPIYGNRSLFYNQITDMAVNPETAMALSAVYRAVNYIADSLMAMPWGVYAKTSSGPLPIEGLGLNALLNKKANQYISARIWRSVMTAYAFLRGNGWSKIERDSDGMAMELGIPIPPERVQLFVDTDSGRLFCRIYDSLDSINGTVGYEDVWYDDMYHLRGYGNALLGDGLLVHGAKSLGMYMGIEQNADSFYQNASRPSGTLNTQEPLDVEQKIELGNYVRDALSTKEGSPNDIIVFDSGMTWNAVGVNPEDAQLFQNRGFQIEDVSRWSALPPYILMDYSKATRNNMEQASIEAVMNGLMPWAIRMENEADIKLIPEQVENRAYTKINLKGLLRADTETRHKSYALGIQWGYLSQDDIRRFEDMPTIPGGDSYWMPLNMQRISRNSNAPVIVGQAMNQSLSQSERFLAAMLEVDRREHEQEIPGPELIHRLYTDDEDDSTGGDDESNEGLIPLDAAQQAMEAMLHIAWVRILRREHSEVEKCSNRDDFPIWLEKWMDSKHHQYVSSSMFEISRAFSKAFATLRDAALEMHVLNYIRARKEEYSKEKSQLGSIMECDDAEIQEQARAEATRWTNLLIEEKS